MAAIALSNGSTLVVRRESVGCAADLALPGRARLVADGHTLATGLAALRAAWPLLSPEARLAAQPPKVEAAPDWSSASVEAIASSQPSILKRLAAAPLDRRESIASLLASRSAGEDVGWRTEGERLRDAGFIAFSLNRAAASSGEAVEDRSSALSPSDLAAAPLAGSSSQPQDWGREAVEARWLANGPIYRITPLRSGRISTICNAFGPVVTLVWEDPSGRRRKIEHLPEHQVVEAEEGIEQQGGRVVARTATPRWHRRPVSRAVEARGEALWAQRFGDASDPAAFASAPRRKPGRRVETPYFLRYDLTMDRTAALASDLRGMEDEADPDSASVAGFGSSLAVRRGHGLRVRPSLAVRMANNSRFVDWLADHGLRERAVVVATLDAAAAEGPDAYWEAMRLLTEKRLRLG